MARRKQHGPTATVIQFPRGGRLDVRDALLNNQMVPTVRQPSELKEAIDARARELADEAYWLCREHLQRRAAWHSECGYPRVINMEKAHQVISDGDLGDALARVYRQKLASIVRQAHSAASISLKFQELAEDVSKAAGIEVL